MDMQSSRSNPKKSPAHSTDAHQKVHVDVCNSIENLVLMSICVYVDIIDLP